jgi:hypothetical protein
MKPTIRSGEFITVAPTAPVDIELGDILLYGSARGLIAHRVVGRKESAPNRFQFIPRGDAAFAPDDPVDGEQALGQVLSVERGKRWVALTGRGARVQQWLWVRGARFQRLVQGITASLQKRLGSNRQT